MFYPIVILAIVFVFTHYGATESPPVTCSYKEIADDPIKLVEFKKKLEDSIKDKSDATKAAGLKILAIISIGGEEKCKEFDTYLLGLLKNVQIELNLLELLKLKLGDNLADCAVLNHFLCDTDIFSNTCDPGWVHFDGSKSCYKIFTGKNQADAQAQCKTQGANLVSIHTPDENQFIIDYAQKNVTLDDRKEGGIWIGLTGPNDEGKYTWADDTEADFFSWSPGQPNGGAEKCVALNADNLDLKKNPEMKGHEFHWDDYKCDVVFRAYVCKKRENFKASKKDISEDPKALEEFKQKLDAVAKSDAAKEAAKKIMEIISKPGPEKEQIMTEYLKGLPVDVQKEIKVDELIKATGKYRGWGRIIDALSNFFG